jgi:hypothetical protein
MLFVEETKKGGRFLNILDELILGVLEAKMDI